VSVRFFPPPAMGEGEGGGEDWWRVPGRASPPHPNLPPPGGKESEVQKGKGEIEN